MAAPPLLALQDIRLTLGAKPMLESAELVVAPGDRICLVAVSYTHLDVYKRQDFIVAVAAVDQIDPNAAIDEIVAAAGPDEIVPGAGVDPVAAIAAVNPLSLIHI